MELSEAARRILRPHWVLLTVCLLLGLGGAFLQHLGDPATYRATARIVLDTPDPKSSAEAAAIADTGRAIVTSAAHVKAAVAEIGAARNIDRVVRNVSLDSLGSSGVLQLSVSDTDPGVAAALANALSEDLIKTRLTATEGKTLTVKRGLLDQIARLNRQIAEANRKVDDLTNRIASSQARADKSLESERDQTIEDRDYLVQQRGSSQSQLDNVVAAESLRPQPTIIEAATKPIVLESSRAVPDVALGGLLGIILGLGLAAAAESFSPTLVGADAVADALGGPLLYELPVLPDKATSVDVATLAASLGLAASNSGVNVVEIVPAAPGIDVSEFAARVEAAWNSDGRTRGEALATRMLSSAIGLSGAEELGVRPSEAPRHVFRPLGADSPLDFSGGWATGLVVMAPFILKRAAVSKIRHVQQISGWPLVGAIIHRPRTRLFGWLPVRRRSQTDQWEVV